MRDNQVAGHGPLTGLVAGVGSGVLLALARAAGWRPGPGVEVGVATGLALIASDGPMTELGVTDPRTWPVSARVSDVVPHLAYGALTAVVSATWRTTDLADFTPVLPLPTRQLGRRMPYFGSKVGPRRESGVSRGRTRAGWRRVGAAGR